MFEGWALKFDFGFWERRFWYFVNIGVFECEFGLFVLVLVLSQMWVMLLTMLKLLFIVFALFPQLNASWSSRHPFNPFIP